VPLRRSRMGARLSSPTQLEMPNKLPKPRKQVSAAKIAADKRAMQAEKLRKAEQRAYDRAYKATAIQAAKAAGKAAALKDAAKKGKRK